MVIKFKTKNELFIGALFTSNKKPIHTQNDETIYRVVEIRAKGVVAVLNDNSSKQKELFKLENMFPIQVTDEILQLLGFELNELQEWREIELESRGYCLKWAESLSKLFIENLHTYNNTISAGVPAYFLHLLQKGYGLYCGELGVSKITVKNLKKQRSLVFS